MKAIALEVSGLLTPSPSGIGLYGRGVIGALRQGPAAEALELTGIYPAGRWRRRRWLDPKIRRRVYWSGARLSRRFDLVHLLDTRFPRSYRGPLVATIFDLVALSPLAEEKALAPTRFRAHKQQAYRELVQRADAIVTLSGEVAREIRERFGADLRVEVVRPGVEFPNFDELSTEAPALLERYRIRAPFVLAVGALCRRKNLEAVVRAFEAARERHHDLQLVLAGEADFGWRGSAAERRVRALGDAVRTPGYLPRRTLWAAFSAAECLLQLSYYEGFGLPVVEALGAGTPVVASDRGGLRDAGGTAAWFVDPESDGAADSLLAVLEGGAAVDAKRSRGREHARLHTWASAAASLRSLYRSIVH